MVSKHVTVRNVQIASAKIEGSTISLSVSPPPHSDWTLSKVSLGKFQDGIFRASSNVDYVVPSNDKSDPSKKLVILEQSLLGRLGVTFGQGSDPETAKGVTAYFDFENPSGKKLRTVEDSQSPDKRTASSARTETVNRASHSSDAMNCGASSLHLFNVWDLPATKTPED